MELFLCKFEVADELQMGSLTSDRNKELEHFTVFQCNIFNIHIFKITVCIQYYSVLVSDVQHSG